MTHITKDEYDIRGMLASKLTCWHRLRETEANELVALVVGLTQPAPVQEPVTTVTSESGNPDVAMSWWHEPPLPVGTKLYTTPPAAQRQWVGLTDDEIQVVLNKVASEYQYGDTFAKAIEAKLKEKNT